MDAVIPIEFRVRSLHLWQYKIAENEELMKAELDLLGEVREESKVKLEEYKRRATQYHNVKVKPRYFKEGDLVLRKIEATGRVEAIGRLKPNWEDPFIITKVLK